MKCCITNFFFKSRNVTNKSCHIYFSDDKYAKFGELINRLATQGNSSNIPGLSVPGAAAASAVAAKSISSAASKSIQGYPGMGGGSSGFSTSASSYGANINAAAAAP